VNLSIINHSNFKVEKPLLKKLNQAFELICIEEGLSNCSVNIKIVDDNEIEDLNKKFRNKDQPTNVLSFTNEDISKQITNNLGDIAISYEFVERESKEQDKSFDDHVVHMFIHGIYHILGFDHKDDPMADKMENKEIILLKKLNINNPYN
jgi:probable rRNA maturation factor